jgi:hypothetical protein
MVSRTLRRSSCVRLCKTPPTLDGVLLVQQLLTRIATNRASLTERHQAARGREAWRWKKSTELSPRNTNPEIRIERAIARWLDDDWVNQVPVASGLTDAMEHRRSRDIVHRITSHEFDDSVSWKELTDRLSNGLINRERATLT